MAALLLGVGVIGVALGIIEIGLGDALSNGSLAGWLLSGLGALLLVGGTAGFMVPLLQEDRTDGGES